MIHSTIRSRRDILRHAAGALSALQFAGMTEAREGERMPDLGGAAGWLNSTLLSEKALRGKVVLVNFWTYSCINSLRELP